MKGNRGGDLMVFGFTTTYAISTCHDYTVVCSNPAHGEAYSIQNYVIKLVSHDITEILLKVALITITLILTLLSNTTVQFNH